MKKNIPIEYCTTIEILHYINGRNEHGLSTSQNLNKVTADKDAKFFAHRNDSYSFIILERGEGCISIDFQTLHLSTFDVLLIAPGQIHDNAQGDSCDYWYIEIPAEMIPPGYLLTFENVTPFQQPRKIKQDEFKDLQAILSMFLGYSKRDNRNGCSLQNELLKVFVCMIANAYALDQSSDLNTRPFQIMRDYKNLLDQNIHFLKSPAEYAAMLNISEVYLNEVTKKTTGFTAGYWIRNKIILETKRLLVYTQLNSKEIAYAMGYDNYAYFNRFFKKETGMTPLEFRKSP